MVILLQLGLALGTASFVARIMLESQKDKINPVLYCGALTVGLIARIICIMLGLMIDPHRDQNPSYMRNNSFREGHPTPTPPTSMFVCLLPYSIPVMIIFYVSAVMVYILTGLVRWITGRYCTENPRPQRNQAPPSLHGAPSQSHFRMSIYSREDRLRARRMCDRRRSREQLMQAQEREDVHNAAFAPPVEIDPEDPPAYSVEQPPPGYDE